MPQTFNHESWSVKYLELKNLGFTASSNELYKESVRNRKIIDGDR